MWFFFGVFFFIIVFGQIQFEIAVGHISTNIRNVRAAHTHTHRESEREIDIRFIWSICFIQMRYCWQMLQRERKIFQIICNSGNVRSKCFYQWLWNNQSRSSFFSLFLLHCVMGCERVRVFIFFSSLIWFPLKVCIRMQTLVSTIWPNCVPYWMNTMRKRSKSKWHYLL